MTRPFGLLLLLVAAGLAVLLAAASGCSTGSGTPSRSASSVSPTSTAGSTSPEAPTSAARQERRAQAPRRFEQCPDELDPLVGRHITLVGTQTRSKIPTVCGVDVAGEHELSDETVEVTGRLERYVIEPRAGDAPPIATRGPGTYYRIVDPDTDRLARTRPD